MAWTCLSYLLLLLIPGLPAHAQTISTSVPLPPLQWLNISGLLSGPAPPPLKDASITYDETSRSLLIFGGESEGGFVQSQTYLQVINYHVPGSPSNIFVIVSILILLYGPLRHLQQLYTPVHLREVRHSVVTTSQPASEYLTLSYRYHIINHL